MIHSYQSDVEQGGWRGTCACGWEGEWHRESTLVAADRAQADYLDHVEGALGPNAYYGASVACRNCGSRHEQPVLVGTHVTSNDCINCGTSMLQPDNETWDESGRRRINWFGL